MGGGGLAPAERLVCPSWRAKNLPDAKITWVDDAL
jgi:hypothetical protein